MHDNTVRLSPGPGSGPIRGVATEGELADVTAICDLIHPSEGCACFTDGGAGRRGAGNQVGRNTVCAGEDQRGCPPNPL